MEKSKEPKHNRTAHSNVRKGLSDFNDGSALSHYGGNDDYKNGTNGPDPYTDNFIFDGSEANGNEWMNEEDDDNDDYEESSHEDART